MSSLICINMIGPSLFARHEREITRKALEMVLRRRRRAVFKTDCFEGLITSDLQAALFNSFSGVRFFLEGDGDDGKSTISFLLSEQIIRAAIANN